MWFYVEKRMSILVLFFFSCPSHQKKNPTPSLVRNLDGLFWHDSADKYMPRCTNCMAYDYEVVVAMLLIPISIFFIFIFRVFIQVCILHISYTSEICPPHDSHLSLVKIIEWCWRASTLLVYNAQ